MSFYNLTDFLDPLHVASISEDADLKEGQLGRSIGIYETEFPDLSETDIVIAGCEDLRGDGNPSGDKAGIDNIRKELYSLYYWHKEVKIADIGNIRIGKSLADTYAAIKTVSEELIRNGKTFILLGGSHDLSMAMYDAYRAMNKIIEVTAVDAYIDLSIDNPVKSRNFCSKELIVNPL